MIIVFMEREHILPKDMTSVTKDYSFIHLPALKDDKTITKKIISSMYKDNIEIKKEKDLSAFHKVDLPLL